MNFDRFVNAKNSDSFLLKGDSGMRASEKQPAQNKDGE